MLEYHINVMIEAQKLTALLSFPAPKIVGFDTINRLPTTILAPESREHKKKLYEKTFDYIKSSQIFTPPAIGEG